MSGEAPGQTGKRLPPLAVFALLFVAFGGYVKGMPLLAGLGVDPTLFAAAVVALVVYLRLLDVRRLPAALALVALLALTFVPGALLSDVQGYSVVKLGTEIPLMFLSIVGGMLILRDERTRRWWLMAVVALGLVVAVLAFAFESQSAAAYGVVSAQTSSTISLGRGAGAAVVVLAALGLAGRRRVLMFALAGCLAVAMLLSGSRGPTFAAVAAVFMVAALMPQRGRVGRIVLATATVGTTAWLAFRADLVASRLLTVGDTSAHARVLLYKVTAPLLWEHPVGAGWGRLQESTPAWTAMISPDGHLYPHNVLLEVGSEGGLLALAGLLIVLAAAFRRQVRAAGSPVEAAMLGLLAFYFLNALVSGDLGDNRGLWVAIGSALATIPTRPVSAPAQSRYPSRSTSRVWEVPTAAVSMPNLMTDPAGAEARPPAPPKA